MTDVISKVSYMTYRSGISGTYGGGGGGTAVVNSGTTHVLQSSFNGRKNPHWKEQIRAVTSATTTASGVKVHVQNGYPTFRLEYWTAAAGVGKKSSVYYRFVFIDRIGYTKTDCSQVPAPSAPSLTTADNRAIAKLYERINSVESSVQAGEDLGEIKQTARLIRSPMQKLRRQASSLLGQYQESLGRNSVRKIVRDLGSTILEYNFGVVPLCNTFADALVGLQNRGYAAHYYPIHARGTHSLETSGIDETKSLSVVSAKTAVHHRRAYDVIYSGIYGVSAGADSRAISDVLRLRFRDVTPTIWNLLPMSWLADYVTNIGTIAESYSVNWNGIRWMNKTIRETNVRSYTLTGFVPFNNCYGPIEVVSPGLTTWSTTSFSRAAQPDMPRPRFEIDLNLSGRQALNVGALIASRIPLLKRLTKRAVAAHPTLPSAFADEVGRRGLRVPYPFHN